jgi:hypothetical protein
VTLPLGGIEGLDDQAVELTEKWLTKSAGNLRVLVESDVANVYRLARLVLDRGGSSDPAPGTIYFDEPTKGDQRRLTQVGLRDDAQDHIDHVILIGGGTHLPLVANLFIEIFGSKVIDPGLFAIDRSDVVALGLSRPKPSRMMNLRYPSWGISAVFRTTLGTTTEVPLYEPFAPTFRIERDRTGAYSHKASVPSDSTSIALVFRPVGDAPAVPWPFVDLPSGCQQIHFALDLFGQLVVSTSFGRDLYEHTQPRPLAPWSPAETKVLAAWLPPWRIGNWWTDMPMYDPVHDN